MLKEAQKIASLAGKKVKKVLPVSSDGSDFSISREYEKEVKSMGYAIGSMQRSDPRAIAKSEKVDYIGKWRNIGVKDYCFMD